MQETTSGAVFEWNYFNHNYLREYTEVESYAYCDGFLSLTGVATPSVTFLFDFGSGKTLWGRLQTCSSKSILFAIVKI